MKKNYLKKGELKHILSVQDLNEMKKDGIEIKLEGRSEVDKHKDAIAKFTFEGKDYAYQKNFHTHDQYPGDKPHLNDYVIVRSMK